MQLRKKRANSETSMSQNELFKVKFKLIVKRSKSSTKRDKFDFFFFSSTLFAFSSTSIRSIFKFTFLSKSFSSVSKSSRTFARRFKIAVRFAQASNFNYYAFLKVSSVVEKDNDLWTFDETKKIFEWKTKKKTWRIKFRKNKKRFQKMIDDHDINFDFVIDSMIDLMIDSMIEKNENDIFNSDENFDVIFLSSIFSKFMKISKFFKRLKIKKAFALFFFRKWFFIC